ncbi:unnamed protein product [Rotaria socialis]|uniref:Uncharacterized protein n=1 Tax=Rotaria socialis TaxID=392032 RepID=A0A818BXE9_9BILA|nr:unnamed protein product [Rotaria socialis]CAF3420478.1 unnamed protein product [Rotaria socialis]CAF4398878.1 unnamed protein product [Rotaria socialis]CAF4468606.1 unnamed protein product [Rotaria socialis]
MDVFLELENKIDKCNECVVQVNDSISKLAEENKSMNKSLHEHISESVRQQADITTQADVLRSPYTVVNGRIRPVCPLIRSYLTVIHD